MPTRFSLRDSIQRTACPVCLAAQATAMASRSTATLAPNPPPTSGAITRTFAGSRPRVPAMAPRASCAFWVLDQIVSRSPVQAAASARGSSGTGARRWLTIVRSITTSQPSKLASSQSPAVPVPSRLLSVPGNSSVSPVRPSSMLGTAGSGSYSTPTSSAASSPWYRPSVSTMATGSPT